MNQPTTPELKKKLKIIFASVGGLCALIILGAGMFGFLKEGESGMPAWFLEALRDERRSLMRGDAIRSLAFITIVFIGMYFEIYRKISASGFYVFIIFFILIDLAVVDRRYFSASNYQRKSRNAGITLSAGDQQVLADTSYFRVMNINGTMSDALTSYYHNSVGGYHGAKIRRYQDLYDSCVVKELQSLIANAQEGTFDFSSYSTLNMLNTKYLMYGQNRENVIPNREANGNAWFVREVKEVKSANEELSTTCSINSKYQAVVDVSQFKLNPVAYDTTAFIRLITHTPNRLKYQATTSVNSLAIFSEVYYPKGWKATLDGVEVPILRANYVLRALEVPAGNHSIEFTFEPNAYRIGNKITMASSWLLIVVLLGSLGWSWKKND